MIRATSQRLLRLLVRAALLAAVLGLSAACVSLCVHQTRPIGANEPQAERFVDRMWSALNYEAWQETGALRWRMAKGRPLFLWDRKRDWVQVRYENERPAVEVYLALASRDGVAVSDAAPLPKTAQAQWLARAYADWANDSFWLIAPFKARDPGTERAWVTGENGTPQVLVSYQTGGVTPGDAYLWHLDEDGRPFAWQMWVQVIPIGGLEVRWGEWHRLATGAWVAQVREGPFGLQMVMDPLEGAFDLADLVTSDPFAPYADALVAQP